jgi:hypothetical protein
MADLYEIFAYDPTGTAEMVLQGWDYLEFTQRINAPWNHNLRFSIAAKDFANQEYVSFLRDTIDKDWILRIRRTDPLTKLRSTVYEGFNRTIVDQAKGNGSIIMNLYGSGYTELLTRRIVLPPTGLESSDKTGKAETVIKAYVDEHAVSPTDAARVIPGLSIEADAAAGNTVSYSARFTNLLSVIKKLSSDGEVDFGIIGGPTVGTYILRVQPSWGVDRTPGNPTGVDPVIFDLEAGNMDIPIYSRNSSDERNFLYIGGAGEGVNRVILTFSTPAVSDTPLNRREAFQDARNEKTTAGLQVNAINYLDTYKAKETLTFNMIQTPSVRWLKHWNLGDLVRAKYYNRNFTQHILSVTVRVGTGAGQGQNEYISPEMETV